MIIILEAKRRKSLKVRVGTLREAVEELEQFRDGPEPKGIDMIGASDMKARCGEVWESGMQIARVSYNGRVWGTDGKEIKLSMWDHDAMDAMLRRDPAELVKSVMERMKQVSN